MIWTNEDRKVLTSELISNALGSATTSPKLEAALIEFFTRIDQELFWNLYNRMLFIVDGGSDASVAQHYEVAEQSIDIIFLSKEHIEVPSQRVLVGIIAHEFAHIILEHATAARPINVGHSLEVEREANELAKSWGFTKEIEAKNVI